MQLPRSASPARAELAATLRLAVPLALSNLLQMAVFATDVIFVARLGQRALAASSLAIAFVSILMMGLGGLTGAVAPVMAAELGRRANAVREVRRSVRMALWLAVGIGLLGIAVCQQSEWILRAIGQEPGLAALSGRFIAVLSFSVPAMAVAQILRNVVSALDRPRYALAITAMAILVNGLGNYLLIFGHWGLPRLELTGSAIASIFTALAMVLAYVAVLSRDRRLRRFHLFGRWWRPEWRRLRQIAGLGLPIALTLIAEGGLFSGATLLMGRVGEVQLAAHAIALQIASIAFQVPFGIGQAASIRVGFQYGAGSRAGMARAGWAALGLGLVCMAVASSVMLLAPRLLVSAYLDPNDPVNAALVGHALGFLFVAAIFQFSDSLQAVVAGMLRGLQDARVPMLIAIVGYWLGGFGAALALLQLTSLGGLGVWIGLAVGLTITAALLLARWIGRERFGIVGTG